MISKTEKVVNLLADGLPFKEEIKFFPSKRIFDNKKVESHSAIIPTYVMPKRLNQEEEQVYEAIKNRLLMQFMPVAEVEETKIITSMDQLELKGSFVTKGKVQLVEGWKKIEKIQSKDVMLPLVQLQEEVFASEAKTTTHTTQPPKEHTEKTLLRLMETCGKNIDAEKEEDVLSILSGFSIGTPATRAETIKKLKDIGYIEAKIRI